MRRRLSKEVGQSLQLIALSVVTMGAYVGLGLLAVRLLR